MQTTPKSGAYGSRLAKPICWCCGAALALVWALLALYLTFHWPFTQRRITEDLEHFSSCKLKVEHFHKVFLPHPGYVAEGFLFLRSSGGRDVQMAKVREITCVGSWISMLFFQHHVSKLILDDVQVLIPSPVPPAVRLSPGMQDKTTVAELIADGAVLDIAPRKPGGKALRFLFNKLNLKNVKKQNSIAIQTELQIPMPPGKLSVSGNFGPFSEHHTGETKLSGSYVLQDADLETTDAVGGTMEGRGSFRGSLAQCQITGTVAVNGFDVQTVGHRVNLTAGFDTTIDGLTGDAVVHSLRAHFEDTDLEGSGSVAEAADGAGKMESFLLASKRARVEDLLWLFTTSKPPALRGPIALSAKVALPPGKLPFLRKLHLAGRFEIQDAEFLHSDTERSLDKLSERARGLKTKDSEVDGQRVLSSFDAQVVADGGTATLSHAHFQTLGATAWGEGTYNLLSKGLDLRAKIAIEASLSKAAGGLKGVLLAPLNPFFKKGTAGAELPVHITGTYSHPQFHVSLTGKR